MARAEGSELVFVVDVTSFTKKGFVGTTNYEGEKVDLEFDEEDEGVYLNSEMARRMGVRKGAPLSVIVEDHAITVVVTRVAAVGNSVRISEAKVYYAIGKEGGAIIRVRSP